MVKLKQCGYRGSSLSPLSVFVKAFVYFVAVTLFWLFGSSTHTVSISDLVLHTVKFCKILYICCISRPCLSYLMTICLFSYNKTSHVRECCCCIILIIREVKFKMGCLVFTLPSVFAFQMLQDSINIFTGRMVLRRKGSHKMAFIKKKKKKDGLHYLRQ